MVPEFVQGMSRQVALQGWEGKRGRLSQPIQITEWRAKPPKAILKPPSSQGQAKCKRVGPLCSRGGFHSPAASPPNPCSGLTAVVCLPFKRNRIFPFLTPAGSLMRHAPGNRAANSRACWITSQSVVRSPNRNLGIPLC